MYFHILSLLFISLIFSRPLQHVSGDFSRINLRLITPRLSENIKDFNAEKYVIVNPPVGKIQGKKINLKGDGLGSVVQFLGIPYAEPPTPVYKLRWNKTVAKKPWKGVHIATKFGAVCPQPLNGPLPDVLLPVWYRPNSDFIRNRTSLMSENCLFVNIYVPISAREKNMFERKLPVMVYFHGHTFSEGSGNFYDGSVLASVGSVIVVTFNYRLGVLGFLSMLKESVPGNYGLWDQLELLKWVQVNIDSFGGNPEEVTVFGSGAGAVSIGMLMLSPHLEYKEYKKENTNKKKSRLLFSRAILQSGTALAPWAIVKEPRKNTKALARALGCWRVLTRDMMDCLRNKSWTELININTHPELYQLAFGPVIDGGNEILFKFPIHLLKEGELVNFKIIIGVNQADGFGYVRDRLKAHGSSSIADDLSYFASKALYNEENFAIDLKSFVDSFYSSSDASLELIERLVKFLYTVWSQPSNAATLKQSIMQLYTDRQWVAPAIERANIQAAAKHRAFFYVFSHKPGTDSHRSWINSALGEEIPFVFGAPLLSSKYQLFPYNFTNTDAMISLAIIRYWTNFAKTGDPMNGTTQKTEYLGKKINKFEGLDWKPYNNTCRQYLEISGEPGIFNNYRAKTVALWNDFLPRLSGIPEQKIKKNPTNIINHRKYNPFLTANDTKQSYSTKPPPAKATEKNDPVMDTQLSMTLAIGFVLLLVNVIAFAIVSYHKESDKLKTERLRSEVKMYQKKFAMYKNSSNFVHSEVDKQHNNINFPPSSADLVAMKSALSHDANGDVATNQKDYSLSSANHVLRFSSASDSTNPATDQLVSLCNCSEPNQKGGYLAKANASEELHLLSDRRNVSHGHIKSGVPNFFESKPKLQELQAKSLNFLASGYQTAPGTLVKNTSNHPSIVQDLPAPKADQTSQRCSSAMGALLSHDSTYPLSSRFLMNGCKSFQPLYDHYQKPSKLSSEHVTNAPQSTLRKPNYYRSVQHLPTPRNKDLSPLTESYNFLHPPMYNHNNGEFDNLSATANHVQCPKPFLSKQRKLQSAPIGNASATTKL